MFFTYFRLSYTYQSAVGSQMKLCSWFIKLTNIIIDESLKIKDIVYLINDLYTDIKSSLFRGNLM